MGIGYTKNSTKLDVLTGIQSFFLHKHSLDYYRPLVNQKFWKSWFDNFCQYACHLYEGADFQRSLLHHSALNCIWEEVHHHQSQFFPFFFLLREREGTSEQGTERERRRILWGTEGREREVGITHSRARAYPKQGSNSPEAGLELMNCEIMTWAKVRCLADWATQVSLKASFIEIWFTSVWCLSSGMEIESGKLTQNGHPIK